MNSRTTLSPVRSHALLSVFFLEERGHHVQGGGGGHPILLPALDGALGNSASVRELLGGKPCLGADSLDAGSVVHHAPIIREDDRDAVGTAAVVAGDLHGSGFRVLAVRDEIHAASKVCQIHALAIAIDGGDAAAVAGLGLAEVLLDRGNRRVIRSGADGCFVAGETVADNRDAHCLGSFGIVGRCVVQLRRQYALMRNPQELFTQYCVFLHRPARGPLNVRVDAPAVASLRSKKDVVAGCIPRLVRVAFFMKVTLKRDRILDLGD